MGKGQTQTQERVIERFRQAHQDRYDYSRVEYIAASQKVEIICATHGVFKQTPVRHYGGYGCKGCAMEISLVGCANTRNHRKEQAIPYRHRRSLTRFIEQSQAVHGKLYDYSLVSYHGNGQKITLRCKTHGEFQISPVKHLTGGGCQRCSAGKTTSKIADNWLDSMGIVEREYPLPEKPSRKVDGFDPVTKTCYQFHGDFFHGNPQLYPSDQMNPRTKQTFGEAYARTQRLDDEIRNLGYTLVVMWESNWRSQKDSGANPAI